MTQALRSLLDGASWGRRLVWLVGIALALMLAWALMLAVMPALDMPVWSELLANPRFTRATALALWVAGASTTLSLMLCYAIGKLLLASDRALGARLPVLLAVPHAALALGLSLLIMPTGWLARLLAQAFDWRRPPDIATVNDPYALSLIGALVLKEAPFLLWVLHAQWRSRSALFRKQLSMAASLGYDANSAWRLLLWPQLLPQLRWALLAVLAYSLSSVEMALIIGPTTPPPLAVLSWQWLNDASRQAEGSTAVMMQVVLLALVAAVLALYQRWLAYASRPRRPTRMRSWQGLRLPWWQALLVIYLAIIATLLLAAVSASWPFPRLLPSSWRIDVVAQSLGSMALLNSVLLGVGSSLLACVLVIIWLESSASSWDRYSATALFSVVIVPPLLLSSGLYQLSLHIKAPANLYAVGLGHCLWILPYSWLVLQPAWRSYDQRYAMIVASLGQRAWRHLLLVKLPLLRAPLAAALAVGLAVSVAQYLPTQFLGAGRVATVTTETVTLGASGQRSLAAAYALWQALLPALAFYCAHLYSKNAYGARN